MFRPVQIDGKMFVDGGCLCRLPIKTVKEMGADVVVAVDVLKNTEETVDDVNNILSMVLRVFDFKSKRSFILKVPLFFQRWLSLLCILLHMRSLNL